MKTSHIALTIALTTVGTLSTADAKKPKVPKPPVEKSALVMVKDIEIKGETGEDFVLGLRRAAEVSVNDADKAPVRVVGETAAAKVIHERSAELEYCWLRVPAAKRTASSAMLKLMIEASGAVALADLDGELPAGVAKCITTVASKWTFPAGDEGCEIEHGLSINSKTDTLR